MRVRLWVYYICYLRCFDIAFTSFIENMKIQNIENSEKESSETKKEIKTKREVNKDKT